MGQSSKTKLIDNLLETSFLEQVTSIESTDYNHIREWIERAAEDINKLFLNLTEKSCRNIKLKKNKVKKKQPWVDAEIRDLKKTVTNLGIDLKRNPFNLQLKTKFYKHCKDLKKIVKQKKYLYKKRTLWSTIEMERNRSQTILESFEYS